MVMGSSLHQLTGPHTGRSGRTLKEVQGGRQRKAVLGRLQCSSSQLQMVSSRVLVCRSARHCQVCPRPRGSKCKRYANSPPPSLPRSQQMWCKAKASLMPALYDPGVPCALSTLCHRQPHSTGCLLPLCLCAQVFQLVQQQGGQPPSHDLAPLLHLYKARLALACHNHKAAKKEVSRHLHTHCHAVYSSGVARLWYSRPPNVPMQYKLLAVPALLMLPVGQAYTVSRTCSAVSCRPTSDLILLCVCCAGAWAAVQ